MKTTTIGIVVFTLLIISLSTFGTTHAYFNTRQVTGTHLISTWQSSFWTQTTQADFLAGVPANIDTTSSPGDVKLAWRNISPMIYATSGNATTTFRQYNVSNNTWNSLRNTPGSISAGGAVADDNLNYLYALRGGGQRNFYRYSIPNNTWSSMTGTPAAINSGGALTYVNQTSLYALRGGGQRNFYRYSIPNNTWSSMTLTPAAINSGGALVYSGGNYLYVLRGNGTTDFYRYSIPNNTWSSMTVTPAAINSGGALVSDYGNNIYAFNGSSQKFWVYNISANTWNDSVVSDPPGSAGWGGSLTYVAGSSGYISRGTLASPVNDTRTAGARWDLLLWDSTTITGTNITFEVRANNTRFAKTATLPAWQQCSWPSPVNSGLPSGRYLQWRATLSTGNSSGTPILNEVRISYS
jgi:hypothetical protein